MPFVQINGDPYYYSGDPAAAGLPAVFCHGSGGSHRHWLYQLKSLAGSAANPLAVDLPGHGRSGGAPCDSVAAYRDWIRAFARALNLGPFVLVGHSLGGAITLDYALTYPEDLAGLVLVGTGGRLRVAPVILDTFREGRMPPDMAEYAYGPAVEPELKELGRREMESTPAAVFLADLTACDRFDVMERLEEIKIPALIICGTDDRLTPLKYSRYLNQQLARSELVEVAEAGHMVMIEKPEPVNQAIAAFMEKLAAGSLR